MTSAANTSSAWPCPCQSVWGTVYTLFLYQHPWSQASAATQVLDHEPHWESVIFEGDGMEDFR